jgi:hypothetical protein
VISKPRSLIALAFVAVIRVLAQSQAPAPQTPRFEDHRVAQIFKGSSAQPILSTPEQLRYRTRILDGVSKGDGVWNGGWKHPINSSGPNFAGHYFVIRWGCGSNCLMMAIVDAKTGTVHGPPLSRDGELYLPMDMLSDREIDFQPDSTLMILRNACKGARSDCGVYYFNWNNDRFVLLKRTLVDLTKVEGLK